MGNLARLLGIGNLHPRETLFANVSAIVAGGEVIIDCDGCASFALSLRDTFNLTIEVSGSVDGTNWDLVPIKPVNQSSILYVAALSGSTQGIYVGECFGFRKLRARCTAFISGSVNVTLAASTAPLPLVGGNNMVTTSLVTTTAAAGGGATLTLGAPGVGLRHYITYLRISRFASALLTAAATPVLITTTNLPGALVFSAEAEAAAAGTRASVVSEDFAFPLAASSQNTATTVICPATAGVIWRVTAGFFPAP